MIYMLDKDLSPEYSLGTSGMWPENKTVDQLVYSLCFSFWFLILFSGKKRRLTIIECGCDINTMIDLAKVADLVS